MNCVDRRYINNNNFMSTVRLNQFCDEVKIKIKFSHTNNYLITISVIDFYWKIDISSIR